MSINLITFEIIKQYLERHGSGGSNIEIESLSITENGTYTASTGYAYNPVSVNVPVFEPAGTMIINENGTFDVAQYSAASVNIPIPSQPSGTLSISENGVYDVASYASANVSVAGGGGVTADDIATTGLTGNVYLTVSSIREYAFRGQALSGVNAPNVLSIGTSAFYSCSKLTAASFPAATLISMYAFYNCTNLTTVSFPAATSIGTSAFYSCSKLTAASFPAATFISTNAFYNCTNLTTVSFPAATFIGGFAFYGCFSLTTANFPVVKSINNQAFRSCRMLTELHLDEVSSVPTLGTSVFISTPIGGYSASAGRYGSVFVPASLYSSFLTATNWSSISSRIVSV